MNILTLGTCRLHDRFIELEKQDRAKAITPRLLGGQTPYTTNCGDALQMIAYARGILAIPREIRRFAFDSYENTPRVDARELIASADVVLLEVIHPFELRFGRYLCTRLRFENVFRPYHPKAIAAWLKALFSGDEVTRREAEDELTKVLESVTEFDPEERAFIRDLLRGITCRRLSMAEIASGIEAMRCLFERPMGVLTHPAGWLPGWRFTYWPGDFAKDVTNACSLLDLPVFRLEDMMKDYDPKEVFGNPKPGPWTYYTREFSGALGEAYFSFAQQVKERKPSWAGDSYGRERQWERTSRPRSEALLSAAAAIQQPNLVVEDVRVAPWFTTRAAIEGECQCGPYVARKLVCDHTNGQSHDVRSTVVVDEPSSVFSFSFFARKEELQYLNLWMGEHADRVEATFDLAGAQVKSSGTVGHGWRFIDVGIEALGDHWCWGHLSVGCQPSTRISILIGLATNAKTMYFDGDGGSGIWLAGARLEASARATSDILGRPKSRLGGVSGALRVGVAGDLTQERIES